MRNIVFVYWNYVFKQFNYSNANNLLTEVCFRCLDIVNKLLEIQKPKLENEMETDTIDDLGTVLQRLNQTQICTLLDYAAKWNTNTRTSKTAQTLLNHILLSISPDELLRYPNIDSVIKAFIPYTSR